MTGCERFSEKLPGYRDDALSVLARYRVGRHVEECGTCRDALDDLRRMGQWVRESTATGPTPDLWPAIALRLDAIDAQLAEQGKPSPRANWGTWMPLRAGAAAALATLIIGIGLFWGEAPRASVVKSLDAAGKAVMVIESESDSTIIWVMDPQVHRGDRGAVPQGSASVFI